VREPNLSVIVAEAWEKAMTLASYGNQPLTVGWWRGQAFVRVWNWRTGQMMWKPFQTTRPERPEPRRLVADDMFTKSWFV